MSDDPLTSSGEDADFRRFLADLKTDKQKKEVLLGNPLFIRRVRLICRTLIKNPDDLEDFFSRVSFKAFDNFEGFEPHYDQPYANFFAWVRRIARNLAISDSRHKSPTYSDERPEEILDLQDGRIDIASDVEVDEALERFFVLVRELAPMDQRIVELWVEGECLEERGYSLREIQQRLADEGYYCAHVTVGNVLKRVTQEFIKREDSYARGLTTVSRKGEQRSGLREKGDAPPKSDTVVKKIRS